MVFKKYLAELLAFAAYGFYTVCFIPQIMINRKERSTEGLSAVYLLSYVLMYIFMIYYVFGCDLILTYKIMIPVEMLTMSVMILQKLRYHGLASDKKFFVALVIIIAMSVAAMPLVWCYPGVCGISCGWIASFFYAMYPIPQVLRVYRARSVDGFSKIFLRLQFCAVVCEGIAAVLLRLPMPTFVTIGSGLFFYGVFMYQFWLYGPRRNTALAGDEPLAQPGVLCQLAHLNSDNCTCCNMNGHVLP